jgi:flavin-binding protein dodecin
MTDVAKVIEIVGSSTQGWEDAVQVALEESKKNNTWNYRYRSS